MSKLTCIEVIFAVCVLNVNCYTAVEPDITNTARAAFLGDQACKTSNKTLLFTATVGIRLSKVKLSTEFSLFW